MKPAVVALLLALLAAPSAAQEKGPPKVDEIKVEEAIRKGVAFLRPKLKALVAGERDKCPDELVLLTLIHAGVPDDDPDVEPLLQVMLKDDLTRTYCVALQAMVLEEIHRVRHQMRIAQCAQFLVDNQGKGGSWTYGEPTTYPVWTPTATKDVATKGSSAGSGAGKVKVFDEAPGMPKKKPPIKQTVPVKKQRDGKDGDNSNTQYATLGLRACHDAGIVLPPDLIELTKKMYEKRQDDTEGDWSYGSGKDGYGSMTAGAIGGRAICDYILGEDWRKDKVVTKGCEWIGRNFSVSENPKREDKKHHYYYLYGLERAGVLTGVQYFTGRDWYAEGATYLLAQQKPNGSWAESGAGNVNDTCFAILFLKRATRPLVASEAAGRK